MGSDPERSVVDADGQSWDVKRLYVGDGSLVPRTLSVNPSLTIMALADRLAATSTPTPRLSRHAPDPRARGGLMEVAVLGLGEAGGRIAADLVAAGCDGARVGSRAPAGGDRQRRKRSERRQGRRRRAQRQCRGRRPRRRSSVAGELGSDTLYADLNTGSPELKRELADALPVRFADVALVGVVPSLGLATPALASGEGAERFAELFRPLGMPVEVVGTRPGDAAGMKLLRSVFMKGTAAAAIESLEAARAAGVEDRVYADIAAVLGEPLLERLLSGSRLHAARRVDEMRAAAAYLEELGVRPRVASAAAETLADLDPRQAVGLERSE